MTGGRSLENGGQERHGRQVKRKRGAGFLRWQDLEKTGEKFCNIFVFNRNSTKREGGLPRKGQEPEVNWFRLTVPPPPPPPPPPSYTHRGKSHAS